MSLQLWDPTPAPQNESLSATWYNKSGPVRGVYGLPGSHTPLIVSAAHFFLFIPPVAHPQSQRSGVRLPHTPDRRRGFLPAPAAVHPVTLPAGAAGLHRLDPRHRPADRWDSRNRDSRTDGTNLTPNEGCVARVNARKCAGSSWKVMMSLSGGSVGVNNATHGGWIVFGCAGFRV